MIKKIQEELLNYVTRNFNVGKDDVFIDESLIDQGIIDSTGLLEIVTFIENKYFLNIEEEQLIMENFGSIEKIASFVKRMIGKSNIV